MDRKYLVALVLVVVFLASGFKFGSIISNTAAGGMCAGKAYQLVVDAQPLCNTASGQGTNTVDVYDPKGGKQTPISSSITCPSGAAAQVSASYQALFPGTYVANQNVIVGSLSYSSSSSFYISDCGVPSPTVQFQATIGALTPQVIALNSQPSYTIFLNGTSVASMPSSYSSSGPALMASPTPVPALTATQGNVTVTVSGVAQSSYACKYLAGSATVFYDKTLQSNPSQFCPQGWLFPEVGTVPWMNILSTVIAGVVLFAVARRFF